MPRIHSILGTFLCLSLILSCQEKKDKPVLPTKTIPITTSGFIGLDQLIPEFVTLESIKYDDQIGYHVSFIQEEWKLVFAIGPLSIPAQSPHCSFKAARSNVSDNQEWVVDDSCQIVLEDVALPGGKTTLLSGACDAVFTMNLSLGENVPYRKVTLTGLTVSFPDCFKAEAQSSIQELEITPEGTSFSFHLSSVEDPDSFRDLFGRLYYTLNVGFSAKASVQSEDYIGPAPESPSEMDFPCSFNFDRIDINSCRLHFDEDELFFYRDRISCLGVLPSFFLGEGSDIRLTSPRLFIDFANDIPFTSSRVDAMAVFDNEYERPTIDFSLSDSGKYFYMPVDDGIRREGIQNIGIEAMDKMFATPFEGGTLFTRLFLQPVFSADGTFIPGKEYRMYANIHWMLPFAFLGHPTTELKSPPLVMEGDVLQAAGGCFHQIAQTIGGDLPFDCEITPVFTLDDDEPVFLKSFPLDKNTKVQVTHQFAPKIPFWKATLYYIVTPTQGKNVFFTKDYGLTVEDTVFTVNFANAQ